MDWLEEVARIRACEKLLLEEFKAGNIKGTIHTSIGQEYVPVILANLAPNSFWFSNHRGHAHYLAKTKDFHGLIAEILGFEGAASGGIGGSQHFYRPKNFISNGIQGGQLGMAAGISSNLIQPNYQTVFFMGDGTTGAGHIYEALNIASLHQSKLLVILENNGIAQSTPTSSTISGNLRDRFSGFGIKYLSWTPEKELIHEDFFALESVIKVAVRNMELGIPTLLEIACSRLGPHSKGDDNRSSQTINQLEKRDFLNRAISEGIYHGWRNSFDEVRRIFDEVKIRKRVSKKEIDSNLQEIKPYGESLQISTYKLKDAINSTLRNAISENSSLLFGEDITDLPISDGTQYGGAFKVTSGLSTEFPDQVYNFPISESAMLGFATGISITGKFVVVEIMFSDFLAQALDQIVHQISKLQSIYGQEIDLPLLIRTASGPGKGYGPTHSHTLESQLVGLPNLEVISANPFIPYQEIFNLWFVKQQCFIVFEPKELYLYSGLDFQSSMYEIRNPTSIYEPVLITPIHTNVDVTVIIYGSAVWSLLKQLDSILFELEISVEVFIPTVISNWITDSLHESLRSSEGRLIVITDNLNTNGFMDSIIIRLFNDGLLKKYESVNFSEWIPNGFMEDDVVLTAKKIRTILLRIFES